MDSFASRTELVVRFGEAEVASLEDPDNTGVPDSSVSTEALDDATQECSTYVAMKYPAPLVTPIPAPLVRVCCDVARFRMYKDRPTEEVKYRYERAVRWLEQLAAGKVQLIIEPMPVEAPTGPATPLGVRYTGGTFGDANLDKMVKL
jgi:phage gp36-like protein